MRRVRDGFRTNKGVTDIEQLTQLHSEATESVGLLQRQTKLSQMYQIDKLVVES